MSESICLKCINYLQIRFDSIEDYDSCIFGNEIRVLRVNQCSHFIQKAEPNPSKEDNFTDEKMKGDKPRRCPICYEMKCTKHS